MPVAHPLISPLPRLVSPAASLLRRAVLARLRAIWPPQDALAFELPDGTQVTLGDGAPVARVRVHDDRLFLRLLLRGEMGAGESYVAGEWSSDDLVGVIRLFLRATGARGFESPLTRLAQLPALVRHRHAANTRTGSERNVHAHYDLGNAFYRLFLDEDTLAYSAAIYPSSGPMPSLADAQRAKLDRLCDLLQLSANDHLLEIGCGWGGMAIHSARTRGCRVTAITVSREQHELASRRVAEAGLSDRVRILYRDYRDLSGADAYRDLSAGAAFRDRSGRGTGRDLPGAGTSSGRSDGHGARFDKIVSIEMLEAVGYEYLPEYFATCARVLAPGGRLAIQSITMPDDRFDAYRRRVDWMQTYIFPGTLIPSLGAIRAASPLLTLVDAHDIGPSYAPTLAAWRERFLARLPEVRRLGFDAPFIRTWLMYLAFSEAAFAERTLGDHQLLFVR